MSYMPDLILDLDLKNIGKMEKEAEKRNKKIGYHLPIDIMEKAINNDTNEPIRLDTADIIRVIEFYMMKVDEDKPFNMKAPLAAFFLVGEETNLYAKGRKMAYLYRPDFKNLFRFIFWNTVIILQHEMTHEDMDDEEFFNI